MGASNRRLTWGRLNRALQELARRPDTRAKIKALFTDSAKCNWDGTYPNVKRIRAVIDGDRVGRVHGLIHELLHIYFEPRLNGLSSRVEEIIIRALETALVNDYLDDDPRRYRAWRKIRKSLLGP